MRRERRRLIGFADSGTLSDLAFLLIIFFMVIAGFTIDRSFLVSLPTLESRRPIPRNEIVHVQIGPTGTYWMDDVHVEPSAVRERVARARSAAPNLTVAALVHPDAPYEAVVRLIDVVRLEGINNVALRMEETR